MSTPYPETPTPYPATSTQIPSSEPRPLVAPWPVVLGLGVGIPTAVGAALGATLGENPQERARSAAVFGVSSAALALPATLVGMLHDYIITKASKKRTALQTLLAYGVPHLAFGTPLVPMLPLFLKRSSTNPPVEEPAPLATEWYKPILTGMGIMAPIGALAGYVSAGLPGALVGSVRGAFSGVAAGMQGMVLDYLVTKIRGKRGPIQNALVYSSPYVAQALLAGSLGLMSLQR